MTFTHQELVERGTHWLATYSGRFGNYLCGVVLSEYRSNNGEIADVLGFRSDKSVLIECKVSIQDFKHDGKKAHRHYANKQQLGNERFYLVPSGLVTQEQIPEGWGLLYASPKQITIELKAPYHAEPEIKVAEYRVLYSLARRANIRGLIPQLCEPLGTV